MSSSNYRRVTLRFSGHRAVSGRTESVCDLELSVRRARDTIVSFYYLAEAVTSRRDAASTSSFFLHVTPPRVKVKSGLPLPGQYLSWLSCRMQRAVC